jgi:hypothetical protein
MILRQLGLTLVGLFLINLCGCAAKISHNLAFNPAEPLRVAVMPFAQVNSKGEFIEPDPSFLIDNVGLVSSKLKETPAMHVRNLVQNALAKTSLDVLAPALIDARLSHNGFAKPDLSMDLAKVFAASPKEVCTKLVTCDAVLYGKVTKWDRSYFAIESTSTVGLDLKLISAKDGTVLYSANDEDSDSRGLTKGPTGFSSLVLEPIKGLDNQIIADLAATVANQIVSPLKASSRPEMVKSSAPAIFASGDDANSGVISPKQPLTVLAYATDHKIATFSIGNVIENVPMVEKDDGHYIGEFTPLPTDRFKNQYVTVRLVDQFGRMTSQKLGRSTLSTQ